MTIRDRRGRFVRVGCEHSDCDGALEIGRDGYAYCNGLRAPDNGGPLYACDRSVEVARGGTKGG